MRIEGTGWDLGARLKDGHFWIWMENGRRSIATGYDAEHFKLWPESASSSLAYSFKESGVERSALMKAIRQALARAVETEGEPQR